MRANFAPVGRLLASPARAMVIDALLEGQALPAGELAALAGVGAPTISEHLAELVSGGLVTVTSTGRHRYYALAGPEIAEALEALSRICPAAPVRSLRQSAAASSLRVARLCYDHLAGVVGVALLDSMIDGGWLVTTADLPQGHDLEVTHLGQDNLAAIGVDVAACRQARRVFARTCLDWTQRRMHLAGAVGAGLATALLDRDWLRRAASGRGLGVTEAGTLGLRTSFGIEVHELRASEPATAPSD
jgi:DNA-binding transcriptional ArsR family regulator